MKRIRGSQFRNRWTERMDRDESWISAASMWGFYMVGAVLVIASTMGLLVSIVFIAQPPDGSLAARIAAGGGLVASLFGFWIGRRLSDDYRVLPGRDAR